MIYYINLLPSVYIYTVPCGARSWPAVRNSSNCRRTLPVEPCPAHTWTRVSTQDEPLRFTRFGKNTSQRESRDKY